MKKMFAAFAVSIALSVAVNAQQVITNADGNPASNEFQAVYSNGKVILSWVGVPDCCSEYYVIERSKNGVDFTEVIRVDGPKDICPYTEYFETDNQPFAGSSFYRLRMVTKQGSANYSAPVPVNLSFNAKKGLFTTTDSNKKVKMQLKGFKNQEVLVVLMDLKGNVVMSKVQVMKDKDQLIAIDTEGKLAPGEYIVTASSKNEIFTQTVTVK